RYSGFPPDYQKNVRFVTRVMRHQLLYFERTDNREALPTEAAVSPEWTTWCPKFFLDPVLRDYAATLTGTEVRFGWQFASLLQEQDSVTADIVEAANGRRHRIVAKYLIGCDGGGSNVRRSVGISLEGAFAEGQNLGIYFRAPTLLSDNPHGSASQYWLVNK